MSNLKIILAISRQAWLVQDSYISTYAPIVAKLLSGEPVSFFEDLERANMEKALPFAAAYIDNKIQLYSSYDEAPKGSIAILPVKNVIMKEDNCGSPGTQTMIQRLRQANEHPNISAHILDVDSGGGSVDGTQDFHDEIVASKKPVIGFGNGTVGSAAYWLISGCSEIIAINSTAQIGSIGTACTLYDNRAALEKYGYKMHYINADGSPDKNQEYFQALDGNYGPLKLGTLNPLNDIFHASVKNNRAGKLNIDAKTNEPLTGKVYLAEEALAKGLIDHIGNFDFAIKRAQELGQAAEAETLEFNKPNNNQYKTTMNIKATWAGIMAFFAGSKEGDPITEEMGEKMNAEITAATQLRADLAAATQRAATAEANLATANTSKAAVEAELASLKASNPGAIETAKKETDKVEGAKANEEDFFCDVDEEVKASREALYGKKK